MGQTLSEPVVEKKSDDGEDDRVAYGLSSMQGWRISMEDAHAAILDLQVEDPTKDFHAASPDDRLSFFGVYDGHGGSQVALYAGDNVHKILTKQEAFKEGEFEQALKDGFLATDRAILSDPKYEEEVSGCTASVGLISKTQIFVANAGDSRTVLGVKGRAKPLSFDHKPQNEGEKARICAAGGFVDFGRVNGNLALSRAIGDFEFKKTDKLPPEQQIVTAFPDVITHSISNDDEFLVIACDGIWDCQSSQAVIEFVRRGIAARQQLSKICENMMDNCLSSNSDTGGLGCDNMTMIVIALLKGRSKDEWYQEIANRVSNGDGPCAPPEYADFRGPGIRHRQRFHREDNEDLYNDSRRLEQGGRPGRIILLGNGTEILTDSDDPEMFDQDDEDKDLESQVSKGQIKPEILTDSDDPEMFDQDDEDKDLDSQVSKGQIKPKEEENEVRSAREATPGPEATVALEKQQSPDGLEHAHLSDKISTTNSETGNASPKQIAATALPEKLVTSPGPA